MKNCLEQNQLSDPKPRLSGKPRESFPFVFIGRVRACYECSIAGGTEAIRGFPDLEWLIANTAAGRVCCHTVNISTPLAPPLNTNLLDTFLSATRHMMLLSVLGKHILVNHFKTVSR